MVKQFKTLEETIEFVEQLKHRWMATVDAMIDPMIIVTSDYEVKQANKAMSDHSGMEIRTVIGKKCYEVFANRDSPCKGCRVQETMNGKEAQTFELDGVCPGKFHEVLSQPLFDSQGQLEGALQIYRDRTLAKQLQKQLLQSEKLASIGLLAGGIAHEINNPLGGILVFSQLLSREIDKDSPLKEYAVEIESAAQRCKSIVENLLDFARQQPGSHEDTLTPIDLIPCVKSALKFGTVGDTSPDIQITEDYQVEQLLALGNRNKVIQVFLNLIQNAFHAMPDGGMLTITAQVEVIDQIEQGVVEIRDSGLGIPPDELDRIFDPFYTSKEEGQGTGLGLSICHGIAEDMGGTIDVESVVDKGSCFRFIVPLTQNKPMTA
ncbi:two-component system sensor histidine kinase NtrB [Pseudobacteriovorax antillogorgiicola]|uniref:histidine kinase n=1 Tax=Pseudobacteriovorax antillogorgiicola TaxID=1513793 RepID=A0A1Y6C259_9BACT|nr:ATP-binding protein [Pseudobacteriovorax antillogorgiicola]TCS51152.1 PAS domain S-box-containing protein [Pseudobacteriovorax antillogorgiicola]SMF38212.1 PAS domain S-box-containing protein [Pseudobacteriovorax antillogorgiicola]